MIFIGYKKRQHLKSYNWEIKYIHRMVPRQYKINCYCLVPPYESQELENGDSTAQLSWAPKEGQSQPGQNRCFNMQLMKLTVSPRTLHLHGALPKP